MANKDINKWKNAEKAVELYKEGMSLLNISKLFKISSGLVATFLKENDIKLRPTRLHKKMEF